DAERPAVALLPPCRGTGVLDRPPGPGGEAARDRGRPKAAPRRVSPLRHRLARASRPSRRRDPEPDYQRQFRLDQPPGPRLRRAVGVLSLRGPERGNRT